MTTSTAWTGLPSILGLLTYFVTYRFAWFRFTYFASRAWKVAFRPWLNPDEA